MMTLYDSIGTTYAQTRKSDPRIAQVLLTLLNLPSGSIVADVGAGTGSYALVLAKAGYRVAAVEPSSMMRSQAVIHSSVRWIDAYAEALPLAGNSVDATVVMLALHHFKDSQQALREIYRITNRKVILFTYDPQMIAHFWLTKYFPSLIADIRSTFSPIATLVSQLEVIADKPVSVEHFALPHDLADSFAAVGWGRPELYLNDSIRAGISSFCKMADSELEQGLSHLRKDIGTGIWERQYGHLREQSHYDAGYRFVYTTNDL